MSEIVLTGTDEQATEEPPGFFGAERAQPAEEIPPEVWAEIDDYLVQNSGGHERLIPLLHKVQERLGYLPFPVQEVIADRLEFDRADLVLEFEVGSLEAGAPSFEFGQALNIPPDQGEFEGRLGHETTQSARLEGPPFEHGKPLMNQRNDALLCGC